MDYEVPEPEEGELPPDLPPGERGYWETVHSLIHEGEVRAWFDEDGKLTLGLTELGRERKRMELGGLLAGGGRAQH
jgi:hypothetical protein